jgi:hypothetical protein
MMTAGTKPYDGPFARLSAPLNLSPLPGLAASGELVVNRMIPRVTMLSKFGMRRPLRKYDAKRNPRSRQLVQKHLL